MTPFTNSTDVDPDVRLALALLAEDERTISYRPKFAKLTGSVTAAILLQQIFYRFRKSGWRPFFKFRSPNGHKLYKEGDSWQEELEFSGSEFDAALSKIGSKSVKGASKSGLMDVKEPEFDERGRMLNLNRLVVYWTDSDRCTWYWLNLELLGKSIKSIYLGNSEKSNYLVIQETGITSDSESVTEIKPDTHTQTARLRADGASSGVVGVRSKFSLEECQRYANHLHASGQGIKNPGGYAMSIYRSGLQDAMISAFLDTGPGEPGNIPTIDACLDCDSSGFTHESIQAGAVRRCTHPKLRVDESQPARKSSAA